MFLDGNKAFEEPYILCLGVRSHEDFKKYILPTEWGKICSLCHEFSHKSLYNVMNHIESKHFPNTFTYSCNKCGAKVGTKKGLERHKAKCMVGGSQMM